MKYEQEINKIKELGKVYLAKRTWNNFTRRANLNYTYKLTNVENVIETIMDYLPSIYSIKIIEDKNYPYKLVELWID